MLRCSIILALLFPISGTGQVSDSFADGDHAQNPTWIGDSAHFLVNMGKELQLDAPSQDASSSLLTPSHAIGGAVWEFYVRLEFDPSGANYLDVRIVSLTVALDGPSYFVRVGGSEDEISLYYQDEQGIDELIDGPDDMVEQAPAIARIRVERTGTGQFTLSADTSGGNNFQSIGNAYDDRLQTSSYFGFECHYTATRSDKFFFDDISVSGAPYQDSIPPKLDTLKVPGKGLIHLRFDEPLDTMGFAQADFELTPAGGFPDSIKTEGGLERIELYYPKDLPNDSQLSLNIPNISDTAGNITGSQTLQLEYLVPETPQEGGVVFNEIMADPTPSNGLPEREYLELHAADTLIQNVKEWRLWIGDDSKKLPQRILRPGDRLLVIHEGDSDLFMPPDPPILMDGLPTLANGGDSLVLEDSNGVIIDRMAYSKDHYGTSNKEDGGWSLERIDPGSGCSSRANWKASEDLNGGTPGAINSVHSPDLDQEPPKALNARTKNDSTILIRFDEGIGGESPPSSSFQMLNGPSIDTVRKGSSSGRLLLQLDASLDSGEWQKLWIGQMVDCFGNQSQSRTLNLILPYPPRGNELRINELLYDPTPTGSDFVELYNRSERILDISKCELAHYQDSIAHKKRIGEEEKLLRPRGYCFLSEDPEAVDREYPGTPLRKGIGMELPSYPNDSGSVILLNREGTVLDRFAYRSSMQHPLLKDPEGVSLERIDPERPSEDPNNWHSAASTADHATPGERNSQRSTDGKEKGKGILWTSPDVFTPDMDGDRDRLRIHYRFSRPGMSCSIEVLDPKGRTVERLVDSEVLDRKGSVIWDGTGSDGSKAPIGPHVILLECIHPEGKRILEKTTCVLGTRW